MIRPLRLLLPLLALTLPIGCAQLWEPLPDPSDQPTASARHLLDGAARLHGVPPDLLTALAWNASSFVSPDGEHAHGKPTWGWLGLSDDQVEAAATLTGLRPEVIRQSRDANVRAGAALLADLAQQLGVDASPDFPDASWWPVVVSWLDYQEEWMAHEHALAVFDTLQTGLDVETEGGHRIVIEPWDLPDLEDIEPLEGPYDESGEFADASIGYPGRARYYPAHWSNYSSRSNGTASIRRIVIHTTEGSYWGSLEWFRFASTNVSAHYTVRRSDGEVTMQVKDRDKAWHVCGGNDDSIGIEHEGYSAQSSTWNDRNLDASARLSGWLARRYNIPVNRDHIVGHGEIQPSYCDFRSDPGPHFPWGWYINKVQYYKTHGPDADPPKPAKITFQEPHAGQQVGNPFKIRVKTKRAHSVDIWVGARRIKKHAHANPVEAVHWVSNGGWKKIKVKAFGAGGRFKGRKSIRVKVRKTANDVVPRVRKVDGRLYALDSEIGGADAHRVRYWANGRPLRDEFKDRLKARPDAFKLFHEFNRNGRPLIVARSYDDDGKLLAEGWTHKAVDNSAGPPVEVNSMHALAVGGTMMQLTADATRGVEKIAYRTGGRAMVDVVTGERRVSGPDYSLWAQFDEPGATTLKVRAFDRAGQIKDNYVTTIHVPSPVLVVGASPLASGAWRVDADAPAGSTRVYLTANGVPVVDPATGQPWLTGPAFVTDASLPAGLVALEAEAVDALGNVLGAWSGSVTGS